MNEKQLNDLIKVIDTHLKEHFERHRLRQEKRNDEDYDDGVEEELTVEVMILINTNKYFNHFIG